MKTTTIASLVLVWWLSASPSWADVEGHAASDEIRIFGLPAGWMLTNDATDPSARYGTLLDLDLYAQADADNAATGVPQIQLMPPDRDVARTSDVGASLVLIVFGGAILAGLRWRMSRSFPSGPAGAR